MTCVKCFVAVPLPSSVSSLRYSPIKAVLMRLQTQQPPHRKRRRAPHLVTVLLKLLPGVVADARVRLGIRQHLPCRRLALVVCLALDFSPLLESAVPSVSQHSLHPHNLPPKHSNTTYLATTSLYFHPNSCPNRPTVQYFLPGFNLNTRSACGTTMRFLRS